MARAKDKKEIKAPGTGLAELLQKLGKKEGTNCINITTATQATKNWKYIDFIDPLTNQPALILEWLLGARGMLAGRVVKIEAEQGVGKTAWMMLQYAMGQKTANAFCIHQESEGAILPPDYIAAFGTNPDEVLINRPGSIERCMMSTDMFTNAIRDTEDPTCTRPILVGVDSVSGFGADADMEEETLDLTSTKGIGSHSRALSRYFRDRTMFLEEKCVLLTMVCQYRANIQISKGPFTPHQAPGSEKTTIGAKPIDYHSSYRIEMRSAQLKTSDGENVGEKVTFKTSKNKISPKGREITLDLYRGKGFDMVAPTIEMLKDNPIVLVDGRTLRVEQAGGAYLRCPLLLGDSTVKSNPEGKREILEMLYADKELLMRVREALRIRGFGFDFETKYMPSKEEIEDLTEMPPGE